ncbi:protease modulator HflC [Fusobacterium sp. PH5-44]|uniref:protease modulator HflC n=1 Tax=unclassified Fusobacterium TaxID=2648384 RepID=UPI003D1C23D6
MKKLMKSISILIVLIIIGTIFYNSVLVITKKNEYTIIKKFEKIERTIDQPGLSLKIPFLEEVSTLPQAIMVYDLTPSDVITRDKKTMTADSYVLWRIKNPQVFVQTLNASLDEARRRIESTVYNSLKTVISNMDQNDIIVIRDGTLQESIEDPVKTSMMEYGIEIKTIEIKRLDLPEDNKQAVYERMISERTKIAATYTAEGEGEAKVIKNSTDREINIRISDANMQAAKIIAEGEGEYMRILSEAYGDSGRREFYSFIRALEASKVSLKSDKKNILILPKDSPIAEIFMKSK